MRGNKCENPNCKAREYCTRFYLYGDMILCHVCFYRVPHKKRSMAVTTGKNQGIENLLAD